MSEAWVLEQWLVRLSDAISSMMGETPRVRTAGPEQDSPPPAGVFWWEQAFTISPDAKLRVGAPEQSWKTIGNTVLTSAGIEDADDDNIRSTFVEILSQSFSGLAQDLSARLRKEIACGPCGQIESPGTSSFPVVVNLGGADLALLVAGSKPLFEACEPPAALALREKAETARSAQPDKETEIETRAYPKGLDLLLDVELPLSVSFGRAQLPIKDVMKLTSGSIIELNRSISEPVEVIVNNVVIARGEVVVLEGNFGIRIKQVISRQERLRTLR